MALFKAPIASIPTTNAALLNGKLESALNVANADTLDNKHYSDLQSEFASTDHIHNNYVNTSDYEDSDVLTKVKNVDGSGSGLDADTVDGSHASAFATVDHTHIGLTPAPTNTQTTFLRDDNTWATVPSGGGGVELGETETTAYRGDRGKTAYDHSQATHAPTTAITSSGVTYENLNTNGDIGTGSDQVANGAHTHDYSSTFAALSHNHSISEITDAATTFATIDHNHVIEDITDLNVSNFAAASHSHSVADTSNPGFMPALTGYQSQFLRDDGTWQDAMGSAPYSDGRLYGANGSTWGGTTKKTLVVKSRTTTTPPEYKETGWVYLLPTGRAGDWSTFTVGSLVTWDGTVWKYYL